MKWLLLVSLLLIPACGQEYDFFVMEEPPIPVETGEVIDHDTYIYVDIIINNEHKLCKHKRHPKHEKEQNRD